MDPCQSGYMYETMTFRGCGYENYQVYSEDTFGGNDHRGSISVSGQGMTRALSNGSHSSTSTYDAFSPQTPNPGWVGDSSTGACFDYEVDANYPYTEYTTDNSNNNNNNNNPWCSPNSFSPATIYYDPVQGGGYGMSPVDPAATQAAMGAGVDVPHTTTTTTTTITTARPVSPMPPATAAGSSDTHGGYKMCLVPGCESKTLFRRKADLQRHYQHRHTPNEQKKQHLCDYPRCVRAVEPFHRIDHFRDHYRDFHQEDLTRKTGEKQEWFDSRKVSGKWWRCTKCLGRNRIEETGWVCAKCSSHCDSTRRGLRGYM